jgi:hypothetical protein
MRDIVLLVVSIVLLLTLVFSIVFFTCTPTGKSVWNEWWFGVQKADDDTNYKTRKKVEDTCRTMIASYESDKLVYEQYKNSDEKEKSSWAEQAKMRANKTAAEYNNYILKNGFVWTNNIPTDIKEQLDYLK